MDQSEYIAAIIASPDDDAPRRAYAEWLTARGDPRGAFITLQLRPESDLAAHEEARRMAGAHGYKWLPPVRGVLGPGWRRGFLESVLMDAEAFLAGADLLFAQTPLRRVAFYREVRPPAAVRIANLRQISRLKEVYFNEATGPEAFAILVASRLLSGLERLEASACPIGDDGAAALASAPWAHLSALTLTGCEIGARGATALAASPVLTTVTDLNLFDNPIADGAVALGQSGRLGRLRILGLGLAKIGAAGAAAFARATSLGALERLDLMGNRLGGAGAVALAGATGLPCLQRLSLSGNAISDEGAVAFARSSCLKELRFLDLRQNIISAAGAQALAAGPGMPRLEWLGLSDNLIHIPGETEVVTDWLGGLSAEPVRAGLPKLQADYGRRFVVE